MSEARERLIEKMSHELLGHQGRAKRALHAALDSPDDLLAVLVEAGVLERGYVEAEAGKPRDRDPHWVRYHEGSLYRRTEGDTR